MYYELMELAELSPQKMDAEILVPKQLERLFDSSRQLHQGYCQTVAVLRPIRLFHIINYLSADMNYASAVGLLTDDMDLSGKQPKMNPELLNRGFPLLESVDQIRAMALEMASEGADQTWRGLLERDKLRSDYQASTQEAQIMGPDVEVRRQIMYQLMNLAIDYFWTGEHREDLKEYVGNQILDFSVKSAGELKRKGRANAFIVPVNTARIASSGDLVIQTKSFRMMFFNYDHLVSPFTKVATDLNTTVHESVHKWETFFGDVYKKRGVKGIENSQWLATALGTLVQYLASDEVGREKYIDEVNTAINGVVSNHQGIGKDIDILLALDNRSFFNTRWRDVLRDHQERYGQREPVISYLFGGKMALEAIEIIEETKLSEAGIGFLKLCFEGMEPKVARERTLNQSGLLRAATQVPYFLSSKGLGRYEYFLTAARRYQ